VPIAGLALALAAGLDELGVLGAGLDELGVLVELGELEQAATATSATAPRV
jgi:hypothetical protein